MIYDNEYTLSVSEQNEFCSIPIEKEDRIFFLQYYTYYLVAPDQYIQVFKMYCAIQISGAFQFCYVRHTDKKR